jgi:hypothetical protein
VSHSYPAPLSVQRSEEAKELSRRTPLVTKEWIERRIKAGYGSGEGDNYKPWLVVQSFSSRGRVHRIKGWKQNRVHHLFSDGERNAFLYYVRPKRVRDIREQYPLLPVEETVEIARAIGVRHPMDPRTKHPIVMTTDFLLTIDETTRSVFYPRTFKYLKDLRKARTLEKLEIERRYWLASPKNLQLKIITEEHISEAFVKNMLWFYSYYRLADLHPLVERDVNQIALTLTGLVLEEASPLRTVAQNCDRILKLKQGTSLIVVRHLLAISHWEVDLNSRISTSNPLILLQKPQIDVYGERRIVA